MKIPDVPGRRPVLSFASGAILFGFGACVLAQAGPGPQQPAVQLPPAPGAGVPVSGGDQQSCPLLPDHAIPMNATIEGKLNMVAESNRLKPGKHLWANSVFEMDLPGCHMEAGAPIYADVTAASASKDHGPSTLSLAFDAADCFGHGKQSLKLVLVGAFAPSDELARGHDAAPTELQGSARQISSTVASTNGYDASLGTAFRGGVRPGTASGLKNVLLAPQGGPGCSSQFTAADRNVVLPPGTILFFIAPSK